ncbi:ABC transporter permease, partial [Paenibacillus sp. AR247]
KMATVMISALPILAVYPFLQKYFVKGVLIGSVKG